jgi:hypothetical protein
MDELEPEASCPAIPGYGILAGTAGLLPWSHVTERMTSALHYWVCIVSPEGRLHVTPVDGLWIDDRLYFGGSPTTRCHRLLAANSAAAVHLESATYVIMLQGDAIELRAPAHELTFQLAAASKAKYGYAPSPEAYAAPGIYVFRPQVVFAWQHVPTDPTRWRV